MANYSGGGEEGRAKAIDHLSANLRENPSDEAMRRLLMEVAVGDIQSWRGGMSAAAIFVLGIVTRGLIIPVILFIAVGEGIRRWRSLSPEMRDFVRQDPHLRRRVRRMTFVLGYVVLLIVSVVYGWRIAL